jgi:heme-degrading monooxygenase HmoA
MRERRKLGLVLAIVEIVQSEIEWLVAAGLLQAVNGIPGSGSRVNSEAALAYAIAALTRGSHSLPRNWLPSPAREARNCAEGTFMIIRICHTTVRAGMIAAWQDNVRRMSIPLAQSARGLLAVYAGAPIDAQAREFVLVTIWRDIESLREYSGGDLHRPMIADEERPLVDRCRVEVFEQSEGVMELFDANR